MWYFCWVFFHFIAQLQHLVAVEKDKTYLWIPNRIGIYWNTVVIQEANHSPDDPLTDCNILFLAQFLVLMVTHVMRELILTCCNNRSYTVDTFDNK